MPPSRRSGHPAGKRCPDCGQRPVNGTLTHDPTCPVAKALDDLLVADAAWFEQHPGVSHRCRFITSAERMELPMIAGTSLSPRTVIHVAQIEPGLRTRSVYVPGDEPVRPGIVALFGHPLTFARAVQALGPIPATYTGVLPSGLEVRLFRLPPGLSPERSGIEVDGLVVLLPGDFLPVPVPPTDGDLGAPVNPN